MKKKSKMKSKQKQKQKQKQSVVINIDNSRKSIKRDKKESQPKQQPSIIPQPIYVPQFNYAPPPQPQVPERQAFRQEPERRPVFNPEPSLVPSNPPPIIPLQQINSSSEAVIPLTPALLPERTFVTAQPTERKAFVSSAVAPSRDTLTPVNPVDERLNNPSDSGYFNQDDTASEAALLDIFMRNKGKSKITKQPSEELRCEAIQKNGAVCGKPVKDGSIYCGIHKNYGNK